MQNNNMAALLSEPGQLLPAAHLRRMLLPFTVRVSDASACSALMLQLFH